MILNGKHEKQNMIQKRVLLILVGAIVLLFFACPKKSSSSQSPTNAQSPQTTTGALSSGDKEGIIPGSQKELPKEAADASPEQRNTVAVRSSREQDLFSSRGMQTPLFPVDSILGPLGQSADYDSDLRGAMDGAKEFLTAMQKGLSFSDNFIEGRSALLSLLLDLNRDRGFWPKSYRMGVPESVSSLQVAVPVLCEGKKGWASGQIIMEKASNKWVVADVQIEWENLGEEGRQRPVFDPGKSTVQR